MPVVIGGGGGRALLLLFTKLFPSSGTVGGGGGSELLGALLLLLVEVAAVFGVRVLAVDVAVVVTTTVAVSVFAVAVLAPAAFSDLLFFPPPFFPPGEMGEEALENCSFAFATNETGAVDAADLVLELEAVMEVLGVIAVAVSETGTEFLFALVLTGVVSFLSDIFGTLNYVEVQPSVSLKLE